MDVHTPTPKNGQQTGILLHLDGKEFDDLATLALLEGCSVQFYLAKVVRWHINGRRDALEAMEAATQIYTPPARVAWPNLLWEAGPRLRDAWATFTRPRLGE